MRFTALLSARLRRVSSAALVLAVGLCAGALAVPACVQAQEAPQAAEAPVAEAHPETAADEEARQNILDAAEAFFDDVSHGVAEAIEKAIAEHGVPTGYIAGEEVSAGFIGGLRYGVGTLVFTDIEGRHVLRRVYWQGPSVGVDAGANASRVFILVYNLRTIEDIYGRRPMVQAGVYVGAGGDVGVDHRKSVTLVPVYSGVGLRLGARVGYVNITPKRQWFPL